MGWKEFFKPSVWKIVLTIAFVVVSMLLFKGLPFKFVETVFGGSPSINYFLLIVDIIFWYLVSCVIFIKKSLK